MEGSPGGLEGGRVTQQSSEEVLELDLGLRTIQGHNPIDHPFLSLFLIETKEGEKKGRGSIKLSTSRTAFFGDDGKDSHEVRAISRLIEG